MIDQPSIPCPADARRRGLASSILRFCAAPGLLLLGGAEALPAQSQEITPEIQERIAAVEELLQEPGPGSIEEFVERHLTPKLASVPMERHRSVLGPWQAQHAGGEIVGASRPDSSRLEIRIRSGTTGWTQILQLMIEPAPPHRIAGLRQGRVDPPEALRKADLTPEEIADAVATVVDQLCRADLYSGSVLLAHRDSVLLTRACGEANKDFSAANRVDSKFNLGSMNKMFTAVAIAQLVEDGKLSFRDTLAQFLPDFPTPDAARKIRMEHLLTHTSGLGSFFNEDFRTSARSQFRTIDDYLELAADDTLAFEPGTDQRYSNTGFLVLGKVIEVVSGQSYDDYLQAHLYGPAGMERTGCFALDRVNPGLAVGYEKLYTADGPVYRNNLFEHVIRGSSAGGCYSTVHDLHRFARALLTGELVGSEYVDLLLSPKEELGSTGYGYGFGIQSDGRIVGHSGGFTGISANLSIFRDSGWIAVALANYGDAAGSVSRKIRALLLDHSAGSRRLQ